jgi:hypothetical protein
MTEEEGGGGESLMLNEPPLIVSRHLPLFVSMHVVGVGVSTGLSMFGHSGAA